MNLTFGLSIASLAFAVILYVTFVAGLIAQKATPPTDIGLVSTVLVFVLFGALGLMLNRAQQSDSA